MIEKPSVAKQGLSGPVETARRGTDKDLAGLDQSLRYREELRAKESATAARSATQPVRRR
jgi:hypothetical protein